MAVLGHGDVQTATRFGQSEAGWFCHVAAPGDGRAPLGQFESTPLDTCDNAGRHTQFNWCGCGSLESFVDPLGNVTAWVRDVQGRVHSRKFQVYARVALDLAISFCQFCLP